MDEALLEINRRQADALEAIAEELKALRMFKEVESSLEFHAGGTSFPAELHNNETGKCVWTDW